MILDLQIVDTFDRKSIGLVDISQYEIEPTNPSMEIEIPTFFTKNVTFTPSSVNLYTAAELGISCANDYLPDGLYTFTYSVQPNNINVVTKSFYRIENLKCMYANLVLSLNQSCHGVSTPSYKDVSKARILMEGAIASANNCDPDTANDLYRTAYKLIQSLQKCCN